MATETTVWACKKCGRCGITEQCSCGGTRAQLAESDARRRFMEAYEPESGWYDDAELTREWRKAEDTGAEEIQRRCRAAAERFEALAGPARVDAVVSADLLLEAASLLRGYHQCLLVEALPNTTREMLELLRYIVHVCDEQAAGVVTEQEPKTLRGAAGTITGAHVNIGINVEAICEKARAIVAKAGR